MRDSCTRNGACRSNDYGQLGSGDEQPHASPFVVRGLMHRPCVSVSCGARCTGVVQNDASLWTFGANQPANRPLAFHQSWANRHGATNAGLNVRSVAFGHAHVVSLTHGKELWTWGYNESYQLGWADAMSNVLLRVGFQKPRVRLSCVKVAHWCMHP